MSTDKRLDAVFNHAQALRAAEAAPHVDINRLIQQCPAHQPHIFVVPVRYALSENLASHFGVRVERSTLGCASRARGHGAGAYPSPRPVQRACLPR